MTRFNQCEPMHSGTAIVIGGSVAGLCMARVLASRFENVLVLERDHLDEEPHPHPSVPQSHQVHILHVRSTDLTRTVPESDA